MKFTSIVLLAVLVAYATSPSCVKTNYCMGCHKTTANLCTTCFNWAKGKIGAKQINTAVTPQDCKTALTPLVSNAKTYSGSTTNTTTAVAYGQVEQCKVTYMNYDDTPAVKTLVCSKTAQYSACKKQKNCNTTLCYKATAANSYNTCKLCKKGYAGATLNANAASSNTGCVKSKTLANCSWEYRSSTTVISCFECKSKFAVKSDGLSCLAFTTDKNCRNLDADGSTCSNCFWAYYWDTAKCKLAAKVVIVAAMMALINFLF